MASIFSGKSARKAALFTEMQSNWQRGEDMGYLDVGKSEADRWLTSGKKDALGNLRTGFKTGRSDLQGGLATARGDITYGRDMGINALNRGYGAAIADVNKYYGQSADVLKESAASWQPFVDKNMAGFDMYQNSLGLGGAEGRAAAEAAFKAGPGYNWAVDQATGAASRAANKIGGAYGGNATSQITTLANNLANQEYGNWVKNLSGFQGGTQAALSGQSGVLADLANTYEQQGNTTSALYANQGKDVSNVYTNAATGLSNAELTQSKNLADLAYTYGQDQATVNTNYSQGMAGNALGYAQGQIGINNNYWGNVIPAGQSAMMAGQAANANSVGAVMGGLQLGASLLGGGAGGGGSMFKSLWGGK